MLINRKYEILYFFGPTTPYLHVPTGEPTLDLTAMAREGLRSKIRQAVHKALEAEQPVTVTDARVKREATYHPVTVTVKPLQSLSAPGGFLLVTFRDAESDPVRSTNPRTAAEESVIKQLEDELKATQEDLQSTIEDLESANEELKGSNEEAMSMNEELQSANEELETSKEELQSLNEELTTVNHQLQDKVDEVEGANNDLSNLLNCTDLATVFLDTHFRIKQYTPSSTRMFNLIAGDIGRPLIDIAQKFTDPDLLRDAGEVLRTLVPREKDVLSDQGRWFILRIMPYRTLDNRIAGVIFIFNDVTEIKKAAERARLFATVLLDSNDAVTVHDFGGRITTWNRGAERMFGYTEAEALRMNAVELMPDQLQNEMFSMWHRLEHGEQVDAYETRRKTKDGRVLDVWVTATVLRDETARVVAIANTERDITRHKRVQAHLEKEVVEIAALEQLRIGANLHDEVGQELTALGLLADTLLNSVQQHSNDDLDLAKKLHQGVNRVLRQVRIDRRGARPCRTGRSRIAGCLERAGSRGQGKRRRGVYLPRHGRGSAPCRHQSPAPFLDSTGSVHQCAQARPCQERQNQPGFRGQSHHSSNCR